MIMHGPTVVHGYRIGSAKPVQVIIKGKGKEDGDKKP